MRRIKKIIVEGGKGLLGYYKKLAGLKSN